MMAFFRPLRDCVWLLLAALCIPAFSVCAFAASAAAPTVAPADPVAVVLQAWLTPSDTSNLRLRGIDRAAVTAFYAARGFRPAWVGNPAANSALAALQGAAADGLDPADYHISILVPPQRFTGVAQAAAYDVMLTDGVLRYAHDLRVGRVEPSHADRMVGVTRAGFDPAASLSAALGGGKFAQWLTDLPPADPQYARLKSALAHYREARAKGGWPALPALKKIELEPGEPAVKILYRRLAAGDAELRAAEPGDVAALEAAVKRYQARNGLAVDGVAGRQTIVALNVSAAGRVAQIEANMERWRWLPHDLGARYIAVNAADATLKIVDKGKVVLTSRAIVGKPKTMTAIFNANVIGVTFNPPWNVPVSIARNEILPKLRRNPAYLAKQHIVVVNGPAGDPYGRTIDWHAVSRNGLRYEFRQLPGDDNSLGFIKMEMPNSFTAYLHDTSSRSLFARDERHLSHGCIRVQAIRPLASYALTGDPAAGLEKVEAEIATGATQRIALDKPLPVYVLYWTAMADVDGAVEFRPDVYGRDQRLIAALAGQPAISGAALDGASFAKTGCVSWAG